VNDLRNANGGMVNPAVDKHFGFLPGVTYRHLIPVSQLCRSYVICLYVAEFCRPGWDLDKFCVFTRGTCCGSRHLAKAIGLTATPVARIGEGLFVGRPRREASWIDPKTCFISVEATGKKKSVAKGSHWIGRWGSSRRRNKSSSQR